MDDRRKTLKTSSIAAAFVAFASLPAAAGCIALDKHTKVFTNNCSFDAYVEYNTIGGGCYQGSSNTLRFTIDRNQRKTFPLLSEKCDSATSWKTHWGWCDWEKWRNGDCKPS